MQETSAWWPATPAAQCCGAASPAQGDAVAKEIAITTRAVEETATMTTTTTTTAPRDVPAVDDAPASSDAAAKDDDETVHAVAATTLVAMPDAAPAGEPVAESAMALAISRGCLTKEQAAACD